MGLLLPYIWLNFVMFSKLFLNDYSSIFFAWLKLFIEFTRKLHKWLVFRLYDICCHFYPIINYIFPLVRSFESLKALFYSFNSNDLVNLLWMLANYKILYSITYEHPSTLAPTKFFHCNRVLNVHKCNFFTFIQII